MGYNWGGPAGLGKLDLKLWSGKQGLSGPPASAPPLASSAWGSQLVPDLVPLTMI